VLDPQPNSEQEPTRNLRNAIFYLVISILLFLANQVAKHPRTNESQSDPFSGVHLELSVTRMPGPVLARNYPTEDATYVVRFRL